MENIQEIAKVQAEVQQSIGTLVVQPVTSKDEYAKAGDVGKMVRSVIAEEESTDESFGRATMLYQCEFCKMVSIKKE